MSSVEIVQRSPEWFAARLGKVTASRVADVCARTKTGWSASRANYMAQIIAERLTGVAAETYTNAAMQWGTEMEPDARRAYEFRQDVDVVEVGFVPHPTITMAGASPDGLVGGDGLVEIKAPNTATHIETILGGSVPAKYIAQVQFQLACTGRQWVDFVSFDPRLSEAMGLFIQRIYRDDKAISEMEIMVRDFLDEVDRKVTALTKRFLAEAA